MAHVSRSLALLLVLAVFTSPAVSPTFTPQVRVGFTTSDEWEPAIAADRLGNVFILYPQYGAVPGCPTCPNPTMVLTISRDRGVTWGAPAVMQPPGTGQWDAQIAVDPVDGRTLFAS